MCCYNNVVDTPATYIRLGFLLISIPNLLLLFTMFVLFVAALLLPFPGRDAPPSRERSGRG